MKTTTNTTTCIEITLNNDEFTILRDASVLLEQIAETFNYEKVKEDERVEVFLDEEVEVVLRKIVELCHSHGLRNV